MLTFSIYRKPTRTDILTHNRSCHPNEHKLASIYYFIQRLNAYPITENGKKEERNMIKKCWKLMGMIQNCSIKLGIKKERKKRRFKISQKITTKMGYIYIFW
jgi:hypothetical protein